MENLKESINKNKTILTLKEIAEEFKNVIYTNVDGIIDIAYQSGIQDAEKHIEEEQERCKENMQKINDDIIELHLIKINDLYKAYKSTKNLYIKALIINELSNFITELNKELNESEEN